MTKKEADKRYNKEMEYIFRNIMEMDEILEKQPDPKKKKQLEMIMDKVKAVIQKKKEIDQLYDKNPT